MDVRAAAPETYLSELRYFPSRRDVLQEGVRDSVLAITATAAAHFCRAREQ
jgi:hypothetical protein